MPGKKNVKKDEDLTIDFMLSNDRFKIDDLIEGTNVAIKMLNKSCGEDNDCRECLRLNECINGLTQAVSDCYWMVKQSLLYVQKYEDKINIEDIE